MATPSQWTANIILMSRGSVRGAWKQTSPTDTRTPKGSTLEAGN